MDGIVRNCVVANDTVISNMPYVNRIAGVAGYGSPSQYHIGAILQNNYALNTMVVQDGNGNVPIIDNLNTEYGMSIPIDSLRSFSFYNTFNNWYQTPWSITPPSGIWKICDGQDLPFLRWQGIDCYYDITATAGINGNINPSGIVNVKGDTNQTFIFTPNTCYETDSLWIDGVYAPDSIAAGSYTFKNITQNHSIEVSFKRLSPDTVIIKDTICYGTDYVQNGFNITNAATDSVYFNNDFNINGCDSVTRLELTVNPVYFTPINENICEGDAYDFRGNLLTASDIYYDTLQSIFGCDSVIELTLTVNPPYFTQISESICEGATYDFHGKLLTASDVYYDTLYSIFGCDSIIELTLTVTDVGIKQLQGYEVTKLQVYPNPVNHELRITGYEGGEIQIFSITGQNLTTSLRGTECRSNPGNNNNDSGLLRSARNDASEIVIDVSHLASGMYFLKVDNKVVRFVKE
jgi:hypothetical protein